MGHPIAETPKRDHGVAATHDPVSDVETHRERLGGDRPCETLDLIGRLDVRPRVRVERDPRTGGAGLVGDRLEQVDGPSPAVVRQAGRRRVARASCDDVPVRRSIERDAEDLAARDLEGPQLRPHRVEGVVRRPVDGRRDRRVDLRKAQLPGCQHAAERGALGKSLTELGALEAGPGDVVQDGIGGDRDRGSDRVGLIPEDRNRADRGIAEWTTDGQPPAQAKTLLDDVGRGRGNGHGRS
jgi:hypothetical protein